MTRILIGATAAVLAAAVALLGGALRGPEGAAAELPAIRQEVGLGLRADGGGTVEALQARLRAEPDDADTLALLGFAYQQRARETGDAAWLGRSEQALLRARALAPGHPVAASGLGSLALSRHRFRDALSFGRAAQAAEPGSARHAGVVVDALVELGRYHAAFAELDRLAARKPGLTAYARVAYARELLGRPGDALEAMLLARDAAGASAESRAWAEVEIGKLHFAAGRPAAAASRYRAALALFPGYPSALDALARAEAARGRPERAVALQRRAVAASPQFAYVAQLADLLRLAGRPAEAAREERTLAAIERLGAAGGVRSELEVARRHADRGLDSAGTIALARAARAARPSIHGDDTLAWALARAGRCGEAEEWSRRALRLGTKDAELLFHRAYIERCLGRHDASRRFLARALGLNPHFSLIWSETALRWAS